MDDKHHPLSPNRRQLVLAGGAALAGSLSLPVLSAPPARAQIAANPAQFALAIRKAIGDAKVNEGKVKLEIPPLSENGNSVTMTITVDSPMTPAEHVKAIHVFAEKNPQPNVISVKLGPRAGRPTIQTRIRLADSQDILAIAELSDGTFWKDTAGVIITLGACLEDLPDGTRTN
jgi:sulfur-oxidizing protein SoxY